jgi:hypothetical protein
VLIILKHKFLQRPSDNGRSRSRVPVGYSSRANACV